MHEILTYLKDAFYILYVLAILTAVIALVLENRNPLKTIAWILVMTCLPIVGFIAYLLFGQKWYKRHIIGKRTLKKFAQSPAMRRLEKSLSTFPQSQWKLASFFIKTESSFPFPANAVTPYFDSLCRFFNQGVSYDVACGIVHEYVVFEMDVLLGMTDFT